MADNLEQIIVEYKLDLSTLKQQFDGIKTDLTGLKTTAETSAKDAGDSFSKNMGKGVDDTKESIKKLGTELQQALAKGHTDAAIKALESLKSATENVTPKMAALQKEIAGNNTQLQQLDKSAASNKNKIEQLKETLGKAVEGMRALQKAGSENSEQFKKLDKEAAAAWGQIDKLTAKAVKYNEEALNWSISNNKAWHSGPHNDALTTDIVIAPLQPITLQFQCVNNIAGTSFNVSLAYSDASVQSFNVTTSGLKTFTFTPPNGVGSLATLSFASASVHGPSNFMVWAISVNAAGNTGVVSNLISLQAQFPFPTLLFTAANNDNAFNFDYSHGLTHRMRLWSKMRYKDYKTQADEANFSDNSNVLLTAYLEKIYEVVIGDAPEFVHDCLTMMQINDTFAINGQTYLRDGNYAVKLRKSTELAPAAFDVKPTQGISKNWNIE